MKNFFLSKVAYDKTLENGMVKNVKEQYVIEALSITEAEARTIKALRPYIEGEFEVIDIKRLKLSEIFFSENADKFFKAKVQFITLDEKSGTEKKINAYMLAQADDIDAAQEVIKQKMKGTLSDYVIAEIKETKIIDVFMYNTSNTSEDDNR